MTWADLLDVLRGYSLVPRSASPADTAAVGSATPVTGVSYDSRRVRPGDVFVALRGQVADGSAFARDAVARGAVAVLSEGHDVEGLPWLTVSDARLALAVTAAAVYGHPSQHMQVVGITGTNGKTTTAYLLASIFEAAGVQTGLLGTVAYRIGRESRDATRTTPEAPDVQGLLREMVDRGCGACVMEVSSHALALRRVDGMTFAAGVFTNLTRDHLDFHADMEDYFRAKARLFEMLPRDHPAIVNADDPRAAAVVAAAGTSITYGISRPADVMPGPLTFALTGLRFDVRTPRGSIAVRSPLVGKPNVYNILAAVATGVALGIPFAAIEEGIAALASVAGRFQVVSTPADDITVVVDYAHTDDALRNLLETARPLTPGRLITVFGCGGDRDRTKRPLMGAVAGRLSDIILITSDNPRSEDPQRIIDEVRRGITPDTRRDSNQTIHATPDRRLAIGQAIDMARAGDVILIAGKGHEKYQVIGSQTLPFDDVAVAEDALARRRTGQRAS